MIKRELTDREKELLHSIETPMNFREMVDMVRKSLPPTRYTRTSYMRACQGLAVF